MFTKRNFSITPEKDTLILLVGSGNFQLPFRSLAKRTMVLENKKCYAIEYVVETNSPENLTIEPDKGWLDVGSEVKILVQRPENLQMKSKSEFLVFKVNYNSFCSAEKKRNSQKQYSTICSSSFRQPSCGDQSRDKLMFGDQGDYDLSQQSFLKSKKVTKDQTSFKYHENKSKRRYKIYEPFCFDEPENTNTNKILPLKHNSNDQHATMISNYVNRTKSFQNFKTEENGSNFKQRSKFTKIYEGTVENTNPNKCVRRYTNSEHLESEQFLNQEKNMEKENTDCPNDPRETCKILKIPKNVDIRKVKETKPEKHPKEIYEAAVENTKPKQCWSSCSSFEHFKSEQFLNHETNLENWNADCVNDPRPTSKPLKKLAKNINIHKAKKTELEKEPEKNKEFYEATVENLNPKQCQSRCPNSEYLESEQFLNHESNLEKVNTDCLNDPQQTSKILKSPKNNNIEKAKETELEKETEKTIIEEAKHEVSLKLIYSVIMIILFCFLADY